MAIRRLLTVLALTASWACAALDGASADAEGFRPLFNGKDLAGWVNVSGHDSTWQVRDGMIVTTGKPICQLRTDRMYENYILELEWKHVQPKGNAGLFVWADDITARGQPFCRAIEVQILDGRNSETYTSHGDVFAIHGARMTPDRPHPKGAMRCLPSERRSRPAGQWNHYRVECIDGVIKLAVNGKVVSGGTGCTPRKGYICLEAEGSEAHFRNLRIRELPSTNPKPEDVAVKDRGFRSLYNGVNLEGWKVADGHRGHWQPNDWRLTYDGKATAKDKNLWTSESFGDFQLIVDWRWTGQAKKAQRPVFGPDGLEITGPDGKPKTVEVMDAGDSGIYLRGSSKSQVNIWCWPSGSGEVYGYRRDTKLPPDVRKALAPQVRADERIGRWNRFVITMVGDRLTVELNGQRVIDHARLPGVAPRGPIALQHHGDPIEFANLYIRELPARK